MTPENPIINKPTHSPPKSCYIRRALVGASPSAIFSKCTLGLHNGPKCKGCDANVSEKWELALRQGLEEGRRNPLFKVSAQGEVTILRELTPKESKAIQECGNIVARFFGSYEEEDEK